MSKFLAQSIFSIGRPHNDTRIDASNVSSFNRLLQSHFTHLCLENPCSHITMLAELKLQSMPSRSCRIYWNLQVCVLECQNWSPTMFLFANCSHCILWHVIVGEAFTVTGENFVEHIFVECHFYLLFIYRILANGIWHVLNTLILITSSSSSLTFTILSYLTRNAIPQINQMILTVNASLYGYPELWLTLVVWCK